MLRRRKNPRSSGAAGSSAVLEKDVDDVPEEAGTWKKPRDSPPSAVTDLASAEFISRLRDDGPQEVMSEGLPEADPAWILPKDAAGTARNVAEALCKFRFGSEVVVDEVRGGFEGFLVTLALADGGILGSCFSNQVRRFDKDLQRTVVALDEMTDGDQPLNKLRVQTLGVDYELEIPEDLWRCELFPCKVRWRIGAKNSNKCDTKYLQRVRGKTEMWKLADTPENHPPGKHRLTKKQEMAAYEIEVDRIVSATVHMDSRSQRKLRKAKLAMQAQREAARNESQSSVNGTEGSSPTVGEGDWQDHLDEDDDDYEEEDLNNEGDEDELWDLSQGS